jgi:type IV secretory pathway protease TraF
MTFERLMLIIVTVLLLCFVSLTYVGITANVTDSEPLGLYAKVGGFPSRGCLIQLRPLIKHLVGVPGDVIQTTAQGSYINGKLWPNSSIPANTHGYRPYPFGKYRLGPHQYWILGDGPDSLDSRYLGMVSADVIATTVKPLWTTSPNNK